MNQSDTGQDPTETDPVAVAAAYDVSGGGPHTPNPCTEAALPATGDVVLDASFVIALLRRDPAASALAHVLPRGVLTTVTAGEVFAALAATGAAPQRIEGVLRALGVRIVDLPLAAAQHFPALRRSDTARRAEQEVTGEETAPLSLGDLCVLGYALATGRPVLTGNQHWIALEAHGLGIAAYLY